MRPKGSRPVRGEVVGKRSVYADTSLAAYSTASPVRGGLRHENCGYTCYDWPYDQDITQCATTGTLPRRAAGAIRRCEALGTTYPHPFRVAGSPVRESRRLPASRRSGARVDGRANSGELLINVVRTSKPKALTGLNQKVSGQELGLPSSPAVAVEPPANRQSLTHP